MEALVTARCTEDGREGAFRKQWGSGAEPEGMLHAYLLEDEEDPRETLSVSFWDSARDLLAYRSSDAAKQREKQLRDLVAKARWQRAYAAFGAEDIDVGGRKLPLLLPLLFVAAGAGVFLFFLKRRGQDQAEEQGQAQEPAPQQTPLASGDTPLADITAGATPASVRERQPLNARTSIP